MIAATNRTSASSGRIRNTPSNSSSRAPLRPWSSTRLIWPVRRDEVEAQGQGVQMLERMARQPAAGALLDRPVERPAQLAQHLGQPLHHHIGQHERRGCDQQRRTRRQRIDGAREQERDQRVEQGGERQQRHRADDTPAQRRLGLAPEDAQDAAQRRAAIELARGRGLECAQLTRQGRVVLSGDGSCHKRAHLGNLEWCRVEWWAVRSPARPDRPLATTAKGTEHGPDDRPGQRAQRGGQGRRDGARHGRADDRCRGRGHRGDGRGRAVGDRADAGHGQGARRRGAAPRWSGWCSTGPRRRCRTWSRPRATSRPSGSR